jgi:hypothetical protein
VVTFPIDDLNVASYQTLQAEGGNTNLLELRQLLKEDNTHRPFSRPMISSAKLEDKYELFAIISHMGDLYDGHYVAYTKDWRGRWCLFNDHRCREWHWEKGGAQTSSSDAYVLLYQKKGFQIDYTQIRTNVLNTLRALETKYGTKSSGVS